MMDYRRLILQVMLGASLLLLFFSGCTKSSQPDQVLETATIPEEQQPAISEVLDNQPTATTVVQDPQPTKTATPRPSPPLTTQPVPAMFRRNEPLGVRFNFSGFANLIQSSNWENSILIVQSFGQNELKIYNAVNGSEIQTFSYNPGRSSYSTDSDLLILAKSSDESTVVEAYQIFSETLQWQIELPGTYQEYVKLFDDSVLIVDDSGIDQATFYLLERATGNLIWQKQSACLKAYGAQLVLESFEVDCGSVLLKIEADNGERIEQVDVDVDIDSNIINLTVAENMKVFIRKSWELEDGIQVENTYLESVELDDGEIIWSFQVSVDVWDFVINGSDIIYRTGNHLIRLNPFVQEIVWQIELLSEVQTTLLPVNNLLLVGSHAGYLHLVNMETGELLWEQDIWATIEPRMVYIDPLGVVGDSVILYTEAGIVSLGLDGNPDLSLPILPPLSTAMPTPTQTPQPIFTPPPAGILPQAPSSFEDWPASIAAFLNSQPQNSDQLDSLLESWQNAPYLTGKQTDFDWQGVDLTGDGRNELLIRLSIEDYFTLGWVIVLQQNLGNQYHIAYAQPAGVPQIFAQTDLNSDETTDFVYNDTFFGVSSSSTTLYPIGWNGQELVNLAAEPITSSNVLPETIKIEDVTGDDNLEIILRGGTLGSAAAGPNRTSTFTYTWSDSGYILLSREPDMPQEYYFFLVEANQLFTAGKIEEAITIFEESMFSEDAFARDDHQLAFAEFQLMLAYLILDDEESAALWAESGNYPDQIYSEAKEIFWSNYEETNDWTTSAEAARKRIRMSGYFGAQLVYWVGYANEPLTLEDICPCSDCLQGTLGSPHYP